MPGSRCGSLSLERGIFRLQTVADTKRPSFSDGSFCTRRTRHCSSLVAVATAHLRWNSRPNGARKGAPNDGELDRRTPASRQKQPTHFRASWSLISGRAEWRTTCWAQFLTNSSRISGTISADPFSNFGHHFGHQFGHRFQPSNQTLGTLNMAWQARGVSGRCDGGSGTVSHRHSQNQVREASRHPAT